MGGFITKFQDFFHMGYSEKRILMLGLDGAGKTTILYKLNLGECINAIPTIGFNVEWITWNSLQLNIWDVGGQEKLRPLWRHYYQNADALIFVIDINDYDRLHTVKYELQCLMKEELLKNATLLIFANKIDLFSPGGQDNISNVELANKLNLDEICCNNVNNMNNNNENNREGENEGEVEVEAGARAGAGNVYEKRSYHIQRTCAISGEGLYLGLDWLTKQLKKKKKISSSSSSSSSS